MCPADQALKLGNYQNLGITSWKAEEKVFGNSSVTTPSTRLLHGKTGLVVL